MPEALKDMIFTPPFYEALSAALGGACPAFDREAFLAQIYDDEWEDRALMARARHTTLVLHAHLPQDFRAALGVLRQIIPAIRPFGFEKLILADYVSVYGLDDWDASLPAFEEFTQQMSAEFAVRPFILKDPERMMAQMLAWARHPNPDVRRLASEGCRPRLPWAIALPPFKADPAPILPILDLLKDDESEMVRRSVANNLNDIAKDNPQVVIEVLGRWREHDTPELRWIMNHALRTLIKKGHPGALALVGYGGETSVTVRNLVIEPDSVPMGGMVTFSFEVESLSQQPQELMIDYILHLVRANGKSGQKVFKLAKKSLGPGEIVQISRKQDFKPITTRRYYPGTHAIEIQINGTVMDRVEFELV